MTHNQWFAVAFGVIASVLFIWGLLSGRAFR